MRNAILKNKYFIFCIKKRYSSMNDLIRMASGLDRKARKSAPVFQTQTQAGADTCPCDGVYAFNPDRLLDSRSTFILAISCFPTAFVGLQDISPAGLP
ncbi:MAG: hypothetical protein MSD82_01020 [Prevotella sp.]|nr:hypothetical protein [Prevotella sp.]